MRVDHDGRGPMGSVAYLDYNATAPLRPEALEAMWPALLSVGNASSQHVTGQAAAEAVEHARRELAELLGCSPGELVFTSGATEANNLALKTVLPMGGTLVTSAVEHPAVLEAGRAKTEGRTLQVIPVDQEGRLDFDALRASLGDGPAVVSIMAANNETGVLTDLRRVVEIAHEMRALVHTDATQLVGRLPVDLSTLDVDLLSLSAHKFGGPQGVGALFVRRGLDLFPRPLLHGGGQERGWRAGTLNVAGIAGAGAAAAAVRTHLLAERRRVESLRDTLEDSLLGAIAGARVNGRRDYRLPNTSSLTFPGTPADAVLAGMLDIAASDGSACASGALAPSHVLLEMGSSREDAESTIRFSLGHATTSGDIEHAIEATPKAVGRVRAALGRGAEGSAETALSLDGDEQASTAPASSGIEGGT